MVQREQGVEQLVTGSRVHRRTLPEEPGSQTVAATVINCCAVATAPTTRKNRFASSYNPDWVGVKLLRLNS